MGCLICAILWILYFVLVFSAPILLLTLILRTRSRRQKGTVAFFHPYCNAGGGGERVLWCAINSMQKEYASKNLRYVVYTGDIDATPKEILSRARDRFGIAVDETKLDFVYLKTRSWLEAKNYPHFTLALQTLAGLLVGIEALCALNPEVFIDTMGYPLTLPLFRWLAGSQVACYVHYPTISTDMIKRVESREPTYNNADWIAASGLLSVCKIVYYRIFAFFYRLCGMCSQVVMVNGSWTRNHILDLWKVPDRTFVVYPPCNIDTFLGLKCDDAEKLLNEKKHLQLLSVGQIRPEKDHRLQICTLSELKKTLNSDEASYSVRLVICGGCRNEEDLERVKNLQKYCKDLQLDENDIEWALNIPIDELCSKMKQSLIGLHTMRNEHFGISVVEGVAAGQIMIAHDSGGPKMDILNATIPDENHRIGFLASSVSGYVDCILKIIRMSEEERNKIRENGKNVIDRFRDSNFALKWNNAVSKLLF